MEYKRFTWKCGNKTFDPKSINCYRIHPALPPFTQRKSINNRWNLIQVKPHSGPANLTLPCQWHSHYWWGCLPSRQPALERVENTAPLESHRALAEAAGTGTWHPISSMTKTGGPINNQLIRVWEPMRRANEGMPVIPSVQVSLHSRLTAWSNTVMHYWQTHTHTHTHSSIWTQQQQNTPWVN